MTKPQDCLCIAYHNFIQKSELQLKQRGNSAINFTFPLMEGLNACAEAANTPIMTAFELNVAPMAIRIADKALPQGNRCQFFPWVLKCFV